MDSGIVNHLSFARNFPKPAEIYIERDHLLDTIAQIPSSEAPVVFLEGPDGAGATTLLAQLAKKYADSSFTLFIKPASRFAYGPDYLRLILAEQIWFFLNGTPLDKEFVDVSQFDGLILQLRKQTRNRTFYFIVDGLHEIVGDDQRVREIFHEVLPLGIDGFRFVITGSQSALQDHVSIKSKTYHVLKLSDAESRQFLVDLTMESCDREELLKLCQGIPGRLASVRRAISSGTPVEAILKHEPTKYLEFLNLEFAPISTLTESQRRLLATLAFARHSISMEEMVDLIPESTTDDLDRIATLCTFVSRSETHLEFKSEAHRRIAEGNLAKYRQEVLTLQVEALIRSPESNVAVRLLPSYYQSLNQQQAIIELLSKDHYSRLLEVTQSISALRARAALGARSALELKQATEVFQFALQRSIFSAVADMDELESEVGALVALGQSKRALEIAAQSSTKEKRLFLLAEFAKKTKQGGSAVEPQIVSYIRELAEAMDYSELGEAAIRLAENLILVDPDLALDIADKAMKANMDERQKNDAYAKLSMMASMGQSIDDREAEQKTRSRITDEKLQSLMTSFNAIVSASSIAEIKKIAMSMEISRRIYFLRQLVALHVKNTQALDLVDFSIDQLVANVSYVPKARDLADFARPLATSGEGPERIRNTVKRIEGQVGLIELGAPSADLVRLQMALAHAELTYNDEEAKSRITDAYFSVASMENIDNKILCLCQMQQALLTIDSDGALEVSDGFRTVILSDLKAQISEILSSTASHYQIALPVVKALAGGDSKAAIAIIEELNTESRRDNAFAELVRAMITTEWSAEKAGDLHKAISRITFAQVRSACVQAVTEEVAKSPDHALWMPEIKRLVSRESNPAALSESAINIAALAVKSGDIDLMTYARKEFDRGLANVDSLPGRVELLFRMSATVAELDHAAGAAYFDSARAARSSSPFSGVQSSALLAMCAGLITRAFRGMFKSDKLNDDHLERFYSLCELIPCSLTRSEILGELACKAWCEGKTDVSRGIVNRFCRPLLEATQLDNPALHAELCEALFPALYCSHSQSAIESLQRIPKAVQEHVLYRTCLMVLRKTSPAEPWEESDNERFRITHENILDAQNLMAYAPTDWCFYAMLAHVSKAVGSKENRTKISGQQRADLVEKLRVLVREKLPDQANIKHHGYVVTSNAQILRILGESRSEEWAGLIRDAEAISNTADRVFVFLEIAECMPARLLAEKKALFQRTYETAVTIPSVADKYNRIENYIRVVKKSSPQEAKTALKQALMLTFDQAQPSTAASYRRNLVDIAEAIDPDYLDQIAEMIDNDPARAEAKSEVKKTVEVCKLRKKLIEATEKGEEQLDGNTQLSKAAWKNLTSLVSGRLETKPPERMIKFLNAAGSLALADAYPVLSWYIENCTRRFVTPADVSKQIEPLCEVLLLSTEIGATIISQAPERKPSLSYSRDVSANQEWSIIVKPGERERAIEFIRAWLRTTTDNTVLYCDPYFSQNDIDFLRLVVAEKPDAKVRILTNKTAVITAATQFTPESFLDQWNSSVLHDPPETEIIAISGMADVGLVHDRWLIVGEQGLRIGTSFNSIGVKKLSEISVMDDTQHSTVSSELAQYFNGQRYVGGNRITYASVLL